MIEQKTLLPLISDDNDFRELIERVQSGSQDAAWEMVDRYGADVQRFVRRSLHRQLRSKFDSLDFVQVVWGSFFRAPEKLKGMDRPEQLVAFLATLAKFKVLTEVRRRLQSAKYDVRREMPFQNHLDGPVMTIPSKASTPSAVAMAREKWEQLLHGQNDTVQAIVELRLRGTSFVDIARQLNIHERTARKAIEKLLPYAAD